MSGLAAILTDPLTFMTLSTLSLPYTPDALSELFSQVADQPWAMLLSSSAADHPDSRYDIFSAAPLKTLTTRGQSTEIFVNGQTLTSERDPLTLVKEAVAELPQLPEPYDGLPFTGEPWVYSVTIWGGVLKRCHNVQWLTSRHRIWRSGFTTGL